jgi:hypothetical protein
MIAEELKIVNRGRYPQLPDVSYLIYIAGACDYATPLGFL